MQSSSLSDDAKGESAAGGMDGKCTDSCVERSKAMSGDESYCTGVETHCCRTAESERTKRCGNVRVEVTQISDEVQATQNSPVGSLDLSELCGSAGASWSEDRRFEETERPFSGSCTTDKYGCFDYDEEYVADDDALDDARVERELSALEALCVPASCRESYDSFQRRRSRCSCDISLHGTPSDDNISSLHEANLHDKSCSDNRTAAPVLGFTQRSHMSHKNVENYRQMQDHNVVSKSDLRFSTLPRRDSAHASESCTDVQHAASAVDDKLLISDVTSPYRRASYNESSSYSPLPYDPNHHPAATTRQRSSFSADRAPLATAARTSTSSSSCPHTPPHNTQPPYPPSATHRPASDLSLDSPIPTTTYDSSMYPYMSQSGSNMSQNGQSGMSVMSQSGVTRVTPSKCGTLLSSLPRNLPAYLLSPLLSNISSPKRNSASENNVASNVASSIGWQRLSRLSVAVCSGAVSKGRRQGSKLTPFGGGKTAGTVFVTTYSFNQDGSCFLCSTSRGFRAYLCSPLTEVVRREDVPGFECACLVASMLFRTNIFAVVHESNPKLLRLWDDSKGLFIGEVPTRQNIVTVKLCRDIIAIVTEYLVYVYRPDIMQPVSIIHTAPNPRGICDVSSSCEEPSAAAATDASADLSPTWRLACPAVALGVVRVQSSFGESCSIAFQAHQNALACMAFNSAGNLLATASETGTVVRIFCSDSGQPLQELRRGSASHVVSCIVFRPDDKFLAVTSTSPTVHVFKLSADNNTNLPNTSSQAYPTPLQPSTSSTKCSPRGICTHYPACHSSTDPPTSSTISSSCSSPPRSTTLNSPPLDVHVPPHTTGTATPPNTASPPFALSAASVLSQGRDVVQDVLKGVFPSYFAASRHFAHFHIPSPDHLAMDVRWFSADRPPQPPTPLRDAVSAFCGRNNQADIPASSQFSLPPARLDASVSPPPSSTRQHIDSSATAIPHPSSWSSPRLTHSDRPHSPTPVTHQRTSPSTSLAPSPRIQHTSSTATAKLYCPDLLTNASQSSQSSLLPRNSGDSSAVRLSSTGCRHRVFGPLCAFCGPRSNYIYTLHYNGIFYEYRFDPAEGGECTLLSAHPWFAPRTDFSIQPPELTSVLSSDMEGGQDGDVWQLLL